MKGSALFNLFLLTIPAYFIWSAFLYPPKARYIPFLISVPVLILQAWIVLGEWFPGVSRPFDTSLVNLGRGRNPGPLTAEGEASEAASKGGRVALMAVWMATFFFLFYFLGSLPATFGFIFLFLLISGRVSWRLAGAVSAGMVVMIWGLFTAMMKFELFGGVLFGSLVPPF